LGVTSQKLQYRLREKIDENKIFILKLGSKNILSKTLELNGNVPNRNKYKI
jgi:hypothetical protein